MEDLECPYCGAEQDMSCAYDLEGIQQMECGECGKNFVFLTEITFSYTASKADCLNGGEHKWKPLIVYPLEFSRMRCVMCDERRAPTKEEWKVINKI